jgi:arsenate reductase
MAEGLARAMAPEGVEVFSAGSSPARVHPQAIAVMAEIGIDIREQWSKSVDDLPLQCIGTLVTLCAEDWCPSAPGRFVRLHWPMPDPTAGAFTTAQVLDGFRCVRDRIETTLHREFGWARPGRG